MTDASRSRARILADRIEQEIAADVGHLEGLEATGNAAGADSMAHDVSEKRLILEGLRALQGLELAAPSPVHDGRCVTCGQRAEVSTSEEGTSCVVGRELAAIVRREGVRG